MFLPINVNLKDKSLLVVGGGGVALQKVKTLAQFTSRITVVATAISAELRAYPLAFREKAYAPSDLDGHFLIYACTNDAGLNRKIKADAAARGLWVNVADASELCDFISPAVCLVNGLAVAVSSQGRDVRAAVRWRDRIKEWMSRGATGS